MSRGSYEVLRISLGVRWIVSHLEVPHDGPWELINQPKLESRLNRTLKSIKVRCSCDRVSNPGSCLNHDGAWNRLSIASFSLEYMP